MSHIQVLDSPIMTARSNLIFGAIFGLTIGLVVIIVPFICFPEVYVKEGIPPFIQFLGKLKCIETNLSDLSSVWCIDMIHYLIGYGIIACGVMMIASYSYLLGVVLANRSDLLPKESCRLCCYGLLIGRCIDSYSQEIV